MTIETDRENEASGQSRRVISNKASHAGGRPLSVLRMSPGINRANGESILSSSSELGNAEVGHLLDKELGKNAIESVDHSINDGPKTEKGPNNPNTLEYFEKDELNTSERKTIPLDQEETSACSEVLIECPRCDQRFSSTHSFTLHIRQHNINNQTNTCSFCGKTLSSASSLDRHMLVHSGERPFKCKVCNMAFTTNGNMHRHMRTHGDIAEEWPKLKNSLKRKATTEAENLPYSKKMNLEEDKTNKEQIVCPVCGKTFLCKYGLQSHMETHPNDPIRCPDCGNISKNYPTYREHQCLENQSGKENGNELSTGKPFVGFHDLSFVEFTSEKFVQVAKSVCEREVRHPSSAFHRFQCEKCNKAFPCGRALQMHQLVHTDKIGTYCPSCQCDFQTPDYLYEHQLKHRSAEHCWSGKELAQQLDSTKTDFLVLLGLKTTNFRNGIKNEIKEENFENMSYFLFGKAEDENFLKKRSQLEAKLNAASSDFADIQSIISLTSKTPLVPCIRSSPVTATPASPPQSRVISCSHPESPLVAESAQASPATPNKEESVDKESAAPNHQPENANEIHPTQKSWPNNYRLSSARPKTFPCHKCTYTSLDKATLKRHLRTHNGERPFQCIICDYPFTTKANCERHVKQCHKMTTKEEISGATRYNPNITETKDDGQPSSTGLETVCKYCSQDFKSQRVLRHHLRSLNNSCSRKPYMCDICKLGFSTKNNCLRHIGKQHPHMKQNPSQAVITTNTNTNMDTSDSQDSVTSVDGSLSKESLEEPLNLSIRPNSFSLVDLRCMSESSRYEDIVNAAHSLVSLSEMHPPQMEPLDLSVRAIDLSAKADSSFVGAGTSTVFINDHFSFKFNGAESQIPFVFSESMTEDSAQDARSAYGMHNHPWGPDRPYLCNHCPSRFTLKSNMDRHIKRKHPEFARPTRSRNYIPSLPSNLHKPSSSPAVSTETRNALRTVLSNKGLAPSDLPAFDYSASASQLEEGADRETTLDLASISDLIDTANSQEFKQYLKEVRPQDQSEAQPTAPNPSGRVKNRNGKKRSSYADSPNSIPCPYCKRRFPWSSSLHRHMLTHTGQKPFKCPKCPVVFTTKSNCERHIGRKHNTGNDFSNRSVPERPFKCNLCTSSTFSTQGNLRKHFYLKHRTRKVSIKNRLSSLSSASKLQKETCHQDSSNPQTDRTGGVFCCHICYRQFPVKEEYFVHIERHYTGDSEAENAEDVKLPATSAPHPPNIRCAFCPRIFETADQFSGHVMVHLTEDGQAPSTSRMASMVSANRSSTPNSSVNARNQSPNTLLSLVPSNRAVGVENRSESPTVPASPDDTDLIQNLLGIHDSKIIDQMLDSADSAARLLGVKKV